MISLGILASPLACGLNRWVDMNLYVHLGDQIGTLGARELGQQLAAWHDAMVRHVRVAGRRRASTCDEDCPHEEATALWAAAQETFGGRAHELGFLRTHGQRRTMSPSHAGPALKPEAAVRLWGASVEAMDRSCGDEKDATSRSCR